MLMIRLQRVGRKNDPSFRAVLTDSHNSTKSGKFLEILGAYDARRGEPSFDAEKIKAWISKGARLSDTMHNLLLRAKIIEGKKINVLPKKTVPAKPVEEAKEAPKAEAPKEEPKAEEAPAPVEEVKEEVAPVAEEPKVEETPAEAPAEPVSEEPGEEPKTE